jgi:hypothetical protein
MTWGLFVLILAVPAIVGFASTVVGRSTDIVRFLSKGANSLILLDSESVQNNGSNEELSPVGEAKSAAEALDQGLDDFFTADPRIVTHRFTG